MYTTCQNKLPVWLQAGPILAPGYRCLFFHLPSLFVETRERPNASTSPEQCQQGLTASRGTIQRKYNVRVEVQCEGPKCNVRVMSTM